MDKPKEKILEENKVSTFYLLSKASMIAFKLVIVPIFLLFFGLFADKTLDTTPLFVVVGFLAGLFFALYKAKKIKDNIK